MELKIKSELRDEIVKVIANSNMPANSAFSIVSALNGLEAIKEEKSK